MATTRRRQSLTLIDQLTSEPWRFTFTQTVRLLEAAVNSNHPRNNGFADQPLAGLNPPQKEVVHFSNQSSLGFSSANISAVKVKQLEEAEADKQWHLITHFFGLSGSQGVMPHYFTEILLQRSRENDEALAAFVNIFEHRSISLFCQASRKYQLALQYEQNRVGGDRKPDMFTQALSSLAGLGTPHLYKSWPIPEESLLGYSGLYARPVRSAAALKGMLQHYFDLDTEIEQFCGQWQDLPKDIVTQLAGGGAGQGCNNALGINTLLGKSCWQVQSKFRIVLAPMSYQSFMELAPGSKKLGALQDFIAFFAGNELDYEICIKLDWEEAEPVKLTNTIGEEPLLGWNTPLGKVTDPVLQTPIDIIVSKHTVPLATGLATAV